MLHGVSAIVLFCFFRKKIWFLLKNIKPLFYKILPLAIGIICADAFTAGCYFLFPVLEVSRIPIVYGLALSLFALLSLRFINQKKYRKVDLRIFSILGFVQGLALLPGISRLAITFVVGRWLGLSPKKSFETSSFIFLPLISGAGFVYGIKVLFSSYANQVLNITTVCVMFASGIVAYCLFWFVSRLAYRKKMWIFSIYFLIPIILSFFL